MESLQRQWHWRFVFGDEEREKSRVFMRMQENFAGCRVLSYYVMSNHFHLLLEVPPMAEGGISDEELLKRLSAIYTEAHVAGGFEAEKWKEVSRIYRRAMGLALGRKSGRADIQRRSQTAATVTKNTAEMLESKDNETVLPDMRLAGMLICGFLILQSPKA